jgi:hypothetical protein
MRNRLDLGDVSGAWLEGHLGWSPMIGDIYNAAELLKLSQRQNRIKVSTANSCKLRASGLAPHWEVEGEDKYIQAIIVEFSREPTMIERLGLTDPAGILWEATPYSFVVDWFLPIGNSLSEMHAVGAVPVSKVIHTNYHVLRGKSSSLVDNLAGLWVDPSMRGLFHGYAKTYEVRRRIYESIFPLIGTLGWIPGEILPKWEPNIWRLFTSAALAHQSLSKLKR